LHGLLGRLGVVRVRMMHRDAVEHCDRREYDTVDQIKVDVEIQKDTKCIVNLSFSSTLYLFTA
jgi:hypothetical protein